MTSEQVPLQPERIVAELNRHLDSQTIVISDAGTPTPYITRYLRLGGAGSRFLIPRSYGGLGYAIPAQVGAHFACPQARLVGLFGDGSLGMSAGELETLARLNIDCVLLHFSNRSFGWIKCMQKLHCSGKYLSVDFTAGGPLPGGQRLRAQSLACGNPPGARPGHAGSLCNQGPGFC